MKNTNLPYNVMNHANQWDKAPRDPISAAIATFATGAAAGTTLSVALAAGAWGWVGVYALSTLAISMVTSALIGALMPKPDMGAATNSGTVLSNNKDALATANFVYGQIRKGGTITYIESTGASNKILHQIIVLAAHEVEEIGDIYFNDEIVTMSSQNVTSAPYNGFAKVYKHTGNQTSKDSTFANSSGTLANTLMSETGVGDDFVGKGLAYLYCRFTYDQDAYTNGLPTVTAVVKGKKVVKTVNGVAQPAAYSNNSAWCIRDYLTSEYGMSDADVNDATFEAAAAVCDDTTVLSNQQAQYQMNGVITGQSTIGSVLQDMVTTCGGTLFWGAGKWRLYAGEFIAPTKTLTLDDFRSGISLDTKVSMRDNFNTIRGTFIDKDQGYISADYPQITSDLFKSEDNDRETVLDLTLPFTTESTSAQRLAKQMLFRGREQLSLSAAFGMNAFDVEVGDFIKLENGRYGWDNGDEKTFEVVGWKLMPDEDAGDLRVNLSLRESSEAAFGFSAADEMAIISNNTTLPKYYEVPSIGVTVSQEYREVNENVVNVLIIQVQSDSVERVDSVILKYKKTSDASFRSVGQTILVNEGVDAGRFEIVGVDAPQLSEPPVNYTISVTPVNSLGFKGATETVSYNLTADTTAPAQPSSLTHQLSGGTLFFEWPAVSELDLSHYKLYYSSNTSSNFGDASVLPAVNKIARPATSITYPSLAGKFFVTSVDKTGNESAAAAETVVLATELPPLNLTITQDEHTSFSGSKLNLTVSGGSLFMTSYTSSGSTGTYNFDHDGLGYIDAGTSRTLRLSSAITVSRKHQDAVAGHLDWDDIPNNWDSWPSNFDTWSDETANFSDFAVVIQARAGATVAGLSSAPWVNASGEVIGRYVQFRATLSNTNAKVTPNITALSAIVEY